MTREEYKAFLTHRSDTVHQVAITCPPLDGVAPEYTGKWIAEAVLAMFDLAYDHPGKIDTDAEALDKYMLAMCMLPKPLFDHVYDQLRRIEQPALVLAEIERAVR